MNSPTRLRIETWIRIGLACAFVLLAGSVAAACNYVWVHERLHTWMNAAYGALDSMEEVVSHGTRADLLVREYARSGREEYRLRAEQETKEARASLETMGRELVVMGASGDAFQRYVDAADRYFAAMSRVVSARHDGGAEAALKQLVESPLDDLSARLREREEAMDRQQHKLFARNSC